MFLELKYPEKLFDSTITRFKRSLNPYHVNKTSLPLYCLLKTKNLLTLYAENFVTLEEKTPRSYSLFARCKQEKFRRPDKKGRKPISSQALMSCLRIRIASNVAIATNYVRKPLTD